MRPVVVFPEGTTTNGTILLSLVPVLQKVSTQVHVMGFKYGTKDFCPAYSFGVWWFHVFRLCAQVCICEHTEIRVEIDARNALKE